MLENKSFNIKISELKFVEKYEEMYSVQENDQLMEDIKENGQLKPITIDRDNRIVDGYRTVRILLLLGIDTVWATRLDQPGSKYLRIQLNNYREKTDADMVAEARIRFQNFPKRQGKRTGEKVDRVKELETQFNNRFKGDVSLNRLEFILNNDIEGDVLSKGIIKNNWKLAPTVDFLNKYKMLDEEKGYGYTKQIQEGEITPAEANKLIQQRLDMEKYKHTFSIPNKCNSYNMDCVSLAEMDQYKGQVDLLLTSPPYWDLRFYNNGDPNQLGHEGSREEFCLNLAKIFQKLVPTLKQSANVVINMGETYRNGVAQRIPFLLIEYIEKHTDLIYKDTLIWSKNNPRPQGEDVKRPINCTEYLLWFVLDPVASKYNLLTFPNKEKEEKGVKLVDGCKDVTSSGKRSKKSKSVTKPYDKFRNHFKQQEVEDIIITNVGENHDIKKILKSGHPAASAAALPITLTMMLSDEGDLVFDPFGGANVMGKCALELNRRYVGTELSEEYFRIGCKMLELGHNNFDRDELDEVNRLVSPDQDSENDYRPAA